mmetsp:Transcript_7106/g.14178  ORF Transcript_7106/g.14178 Transcript_7106/m.14178 type:complete len:223 (-) Transcript_7106:385-1053(-)
MRCTSAPSPLKMPANSTAIYPPPTITILSLATLSNTRASSEVIACSAPGIFSLTACPPVATKIFFVLRRSTDPSWHRTSTVWSSRIKPLPSIYSTPEFFKMLTYTPFNLSISFALRSSKLEISCPVVGGCQPNPPASSKLSVNSDAYTKSFFGTHPRITHVPPAPPTESLDTNPKGSSTMATLAPYTLDATREALTPPEPAPMVTKSYSNVFMESLIYLDSI